MVNSPYSETIADCIGLNLEYYPDLETSEVTFALSETSALPAGLALSEDGTISGTPTVEARLSFTVIATYGGRADQTKTQTFTINIAGEGGAIVYEPEVSVLTANIGTAYNGDVAQAEIFDPYADESTVFPEITYTLANGSRLPSGLTLAANGAITGTPDKECRDYAFTVTASALGYSDTECTFTISVLYPLEYKAAALEDGSYGKPYLAAINTADCDAPVTYALKDGSTLPKGLKLSSGGYIVGIPEEACSSTFTVIASSAYAAPVEAEYTLKINPTFDSATKLPYGKAGEAYVGSVATAQGSFDIKYSLVSGALPEGLTLSEDGSITGTPTKSGTYEIVVRAQDGDLSTDVALTLFIDNGTVVPSGGGCGSSVSGTGIALIGVAALVCAGVAIVRRRSASPKRDGRNGGIGFPGAPQKKRRPEFDIGGPPPPPRGPRPIRQGERYRK